MRSVVDIFVVCSWFCSVITSYLKARFVSATAAYGCIEGTEIATIRYYKSDHDLFHVASSIYKFDNNSSVLLSGW